jgi:hypothetical protein
MPLQMFPLRTFPIGSFLLSPHLDVVAWAEAHTLATVTGAAMERFEKWLLGYFEMGFPPSITNNPALVTYDDRQGPGFSTSRLSASMRLAEERFPGALEDWGWGGRDVQLGAAALHVTGSIANIVLAGEPVDCWHARGKQVSWIWRRDPATQVEGRRPLTPLEKKLALEDGDVLGVGLWSEVPALDNSPGSDFGDYLAGVYARSATTGAPQGIVARYRAGGSAPVVLSGRAPPPPGAP